MPGSEWEVSALERLLREGSDDDIKRFIVLLKPPELADLIERTPEDQRLRVLRLMSTPLASEVLREVQEPEREEILEGMPSAEIAEIVQESFSDDAADFLAALPPDKQERTLDKLDDESRQEIEGLLRYGEETAGGIMQTEVVRATSDLTVEEALAVVRGADMDDVGEIHEVYVVDRDGRLLGSVSPAELLHARPDAKVREIADPDPVRAPVSMDQEELAELVREHDLASIPVVDKTGVLVGQILHDDVADVIEEEATEDIVRLAGAAPEEVGGDSILLKVRSRGPWLLPAFVGGLIASSIVSSVSGRLSQAALLVAFIPVVLGMAGNIGSQAAVITVRGIALGRLDLGRAWRILLKEGLTGITLGLMFGLLLAVFFFWQHPGDAHVKTYMLTLGLAICNSMTVGTLMGVLVPITLHRFGKDPAVATSPFVQTSNDVLGVTVLFLVAEAVGLIS